MRYKRNLLVFYALKINMAKFPFPIISKRFATIL